MSELMQRGPLRLQVAPEDDGRPLGELLAEALGNAEAALEVLGHGGAWVGKTRVQNGAAPVASGELLTISRPSGGIYADVRIDPRWIIFECADLIALDKPPGYYVDVTPWDVDGNLRAALLRFLTERDGAPPRLHLAHRLDRDTSGVLLLSKSPQVNAALQESFAGEVRKEYLGDCVGEPAADEFELATGHGRGAHGLFQIYPLEQVGNTLPNGSRVKHMRTRFVVEERRGDGALVRAFPATGRTHQIRLHLAHLGHPLVGDTRYGGPDTWRGQPAPRHRLHAARLELRHPRSGRPLVLMSEPPPWAAG